MDFSKRNKKVAISRWTKILEQERNSILNTDEGVVLKSAICGFLAGDGSITIRKQGKAMHREARFFPDDMEMIDAYCSAIQKVYGKSPNIKRNGRFYQVRITSRVIVEDITKLANFGLYRWDLPEKLFSTKGAKEAWLRAFFSAEAYVGQKAIKIQTVNAEGMLGISKLLCDLGIEHKNYTYTPKNNKHSPVSIIVILKEKARKIFCEKIGFWHGKKTKNLEKALGL